MPVATLKLFAVGAIGRMKHAVHGGQIGIPGVKSLSTPDILNRHHHILHSARVIHVKFLEEDEPFPIRYSFAKISEWVQDHRKCTGLRNRTVERHFAGDGSAIFYLAIF